MYVFNMIIIRTIINYYLAPKILEVHIRMISEGSWTLKTGE